MAVALTVAGSRKDLASVDPSIRSVWLSAFSAAHRIGGDVDQAEEIAQTAVMRYLLDPERIRCAATWAATLARNEIRDRARRSRRFSRLRDEIVQPGDDPEQRAVRRLSLGQALESATSEDRTLLLGVLQGCSHRELASARAIPVSAVGAYLNRAMTRLKRALER